MKLFIRPMSLQAQRPYKSNKISELINSYTVLTLCGVSPLVNSVPSMVNLSKATRTDSLFYCAVKQTFFKHFCGELD